MIQTDLLSPAPLAYEPFSTLAMIYEDNGDVDKALQFGLIAAHLNPSDHEEWIRLAEMSLEQDNIRQAVICYSKGRPSPSDASQNACFPTVRELVVEF